jgi:hypothetical protein
MIEGDDPMHLGARQVERVSDKRYRGLGDAAEFFLERMETGQHSPLLGGVFPDYVPRQILFPLGERHFSLLLLSIQH